MNDIFAEAEKRRKWLESLPDGTPCDHVGCLSHISHPCEVCGRVGGQRAQQRLKRTGYIASTSIGEKCLGCNEYDCRCADYSASSLR